MVLTTSGLVSRRIIMCSAIQPSRLAMRSRGAGPGIFSPGAHYHRSRSRKTRCIFIREMADIFLFHRRAGPGNVLLPFFQGSSDRVETWNKFSPLLRRSISFPPTRVMMCILQTTYGLSVISTAYLRPGRTDRPHGEGDDVQGAAFHTAFVKRQHGRF